MVTLMVPTCKRVHPFSFIVQARSGQVQACPVHRHRLQFFCFRWSFCITLGNILAFFLLCSDKFSFLRKSKKAMTHRWPSCLSWISAHPERCSPIVEQACCWAPFFHVRSPLRGSLAAYLPLNAVSLAGAQNLSTASWACVIHKPATP